AAPPACYSPSRAVRPPSCSASRTSSRSRRRSPSSVTRSCWRPSARPTPRSLPALPPGCRARGRWTRSSGDRRASAVRDLLGAGAASAAEAAREGGDGGCRIHLRPAGRQSEPGWATPPVRARRQAQRASGGLPGRVPHRRATPAGRGAGDRPSVRPLPPGVTAGGDGEPGLGQERPGQDDEEGDQLGEGGGGEAEGDDGQGEGGGGAAEVAGADGQGAAEE